MRHGQWREDPMGRIRGGWKRLHKRLKIRYNMHETHVGREEVVKDFKYHLSVENCRAIKSAEIDLSEITVLTGVNASGKSTIARMLRDLVELSAEYERLLAVRMWQGRMDMWRYVVTGSARLAPRVKVPFRYLTKNLADGTAAFPEAVAMLDQALRDVLSGGETAREESMFVQRARRLLDLGDEPLDVLAVFRQEADNLLQKFERRRTSRSYVAYRDLMDGNPLMEGRITLEEGGRVVFSNDSARDTLDEISFIKRAIYIESPLKSFPRAISLSALNMEDGFTRVKEDVLTGGFERLPELAEVLSGDFAYVKEYEEEENEDVRALLGHSGHWFYQRKDGGKFALEDCATGIKALSILSVLYSRGWLDAETLLIIDEPEAHLHPQWVVEYARILLLLSKRLRVRIIVTSHSPDMVNALHTIGLALGMGQDIGFYLAEADEKEKYKFNYRPLKNKVGDIFKAYNVSFDRIDSYARSVGEDI